MKTKKWNDEKSEKKIELWMTSPAGTGIAGVDLVGRGVKRVLVS